MRWPYRWAVASGAAYLLFVGLACAEVQTGWLGREFPRLFRKGDPTADMVEWWPLAKIPNLGDSAGTEKTFVLTFNWRDAAKIDQALGDQMPVVVASNDPRDFAYVDGEASLQGRSALIVSRPTQSRSALGDVGGCFAEVHPLGQIGIRREGSVVASFTVSRGISYRPSQCEKR